MCAHAHRFRFEGCEDINAYPLWAGSVRCSFRALDGNQRHTGRLCWVVLRICPNPESCESMGAWINHLQSGRQVGCVAKGRPPKSNVLVLSRECGNEPSIPLKGNHKGWFVNDIPSFPAEHQQDCPQRNRFATFQGPETPHQPSLAIDLVVELGHCPPQCPIAVGAAIVQVLLGEQRSFLPNEEKGPLDQPPNLGCPFSDPPLKVTHF